MNLTLWLTMAFAQTFAIAIVAWVVWRRGERMLVVGAVLLAIGVLHLGVNLVWLGTGASGGSPIQMRGGMTGFWLSSLSALEIAALGVLALVRARPKREGRSALTGP